MRVAIMKKFFNITIFFGTIFFLFSGMVYTQEIHGIRESMDWEGRYMGTLPCASCPGIVTILTLNEGGSYTLTETYLGNKGGTFHSNGKFIWDKAGMCITLLPSTKEDKRSYLVSKGSIIQTYDGEPARDEYRLHRQDEFNGNGEQLYVNSESVTPISGKGTDIVQFDALLNFEHRMQGGHKSLTATVQIDCRRRTVDFPVIAYFTQHDAAGKELTSSDSNGGNAHPLSKDTDDVFVQAAKAYCP